jgi:SSS family solute:Na+ symporter
MSARDERHALLATLWYTVANFCLRPWPWVVVALVSVVLYPDLTDKEAGYVMVLRDHLPSGWRGLLIGAFFAAYMSTVGTQLNWGTSYVVNDLYRRFVRPEGEEAHYVRVSRFVTLLIMVIAAVVTFYLESIRQAWEFILESGAGIGLVLMLRWYWWRINAWSEIAAMVAPAVGFLYLKAFTDVVFPYTLIYLAGWTAFWTVMVTLLTPPEPMSRLLIFYRRVRPGGPGWRPVAAIAGGASPDSLAPLLLDWAAGCVLVYGTLLGTGALLFRQPQEALLYLVAAGGAAALVYWNVSRRGWGAVMGETTTEEEFPDEP